MALPTGLAITARHTIVHAVQAAGLSLIALVQEIASVTLLAGSGIRAGVTAINLAGGTSSTVLIEEIIGNANLACVFLQTVLAA